MVNPGFWKQFWKKKIIPKWKVFCWKIINNAMPTSCNLRRRLVSVEGVRPMCKVCQETAEHFFRECPISSRIWQARGLGICGSTSPSIGLGSWVVNFLALFFKQDGQDNYRAIEFISTIWSIWLHRNEVVFKNNPCSPERIMGLENEWSSRGVPYAREGNVEGKSVHGGERKLTAARWVYGRPVGRSFVSIVVDAAWKAFQKRNSKKWGATVAWKGERREDDHIEGGTRVFAESPLHAECMAISYGMRGCVGITRNIIVKSDYQDAIMAIADPGRADFRVADMAREIREIARNFDYVICLKVGRECVKPAHIIASRTRKGLVV
ncbi:uncharacterized protein [Spinacia oleracea]|uniref:Reverse transcriptase zinc-binding domain-containing protein n=1 Tax=Spinacia oleracea TaxID=3562 RepID=A0ABM3RPZ2_SPIOL|nr:uncharacterized protein LOC130471517 [Spinacia oleracea]